MGAVSVSIGRPPRHRCSRILPASATISSPIPSPGKMAILIGPLERLIARLQRRARRHPREQREQSKPSCLLCPGVLLGAVRSEEPRLLGFALRLERANLVGVSKREPDVVETCLLYTSPSP